MTGALGDICKKKKFLIFRCVFLRGLKVSLVHFLDALSEEMGASTKCKEKGWSYCRKTRGECFLATFEGPPSITFQERTQALGKWGGVHDEREDR